MSQSTTEEDGTMDLPAICQDFFTVETWMDFFRYGGGWDVTLMLKNITFKGILT
jgi:hypothetical protein